MATRARHQTGTIMERSGIFYVRYYLTVEGKRKRFTERLGAKDHKHHSTTCAPVKRWRDEFMLKINAQAGATPRTNARSVTVAEFWKDTYLPWLEREKRASTILGYKKIWKQHLESHFGNRTLVDYRPHEGAKFLNGLAKTLRRRSLQHIRSLASGIFTLAVNQEGLLERNPWRDVKVMAKMKADEPTEKYTLPEAEAILGALRGHLNAQTVFSLAFFLGLRPSEIAGLRWEDIEEDAIHIQRAAVRGVVDGTKTDGTRRVPLIQPVRGLLQLWRESSAGVTEGWVFPNRGGKPANMDEFPRRAIEPLLEKKSIEWKGLYAARRGAATILTELAKDRGLAAMGLHGHKSLGTTQDHYILAVPEETLRAVRLLEAATSFKAGQ